MYIHVRYLRDSMAVHLRRLTIEKYSQIELMLAHETRWNGFHWHITNSCLKSAEIYSRPVLIPGFHITGCPGQPFPPVGQPKNWPLFSRQGNQNFRYMSLHLYCWATKMSCRATSIWYWLADRATGFQNECKTLDPARNAADRPIYLILPCAFFSDCCVCSSTGQRTSTSARRFVPDCAPSASRKQVRVFFLSFFLAISFSSHNFKVVEFSKLIVLRLELCKFCKMLT